MTALVSYCRLTEQRSRISPWLPPSGDKRHINVVELEAAIKGLSLAVGWNFETVHLKTDSNTVASWLRDVIGNVRRVRTKALYEVLVQRRLQIVADMIQTAKLTVTVDWVPSADNPADVMTRVPEVGVKLCQASRQTADVVAISAPSPVTLTQVSDAQACDADIRDAIMRLTSEPKLPVTGKFTAVTAQLEVDECVLFRSVKLPIEGTVCVPVIPDALVKDVLRNAHASTGHGNWHAMYRLIRSRAYFPGIASKCNEFVVGCSRCKAADWTKGDSAPPTRPDIPCGPWSEVVIDTLELGEDNSGRYHCVLVCVDVFTEVGGSLPSASTRCCLCCIRIRIDVFCDGVRRKLSGWTTVRSLVTRLWSRCFVCSAFMCAPVLFVILSRKGRLNESIARCSGSYGKFWIRHPAGVKISTSFCHYLSQPSS